MKLTLEVFIYVCMCIYINKYTYMFIDINKGYLDEVANLYYWLS